MRTLGSFGALCKISDSTILMVEYRLLLFLPISQGQSDFEALYLVKEQLGHMILLNIHRKAYMGSPLMRLHLTSVTLKDQCQGHSDFENLYLIKDLS